MFNFGKNLYGPPPPPVAMADDEDDDGDVVMKDVEEELFEFPEPVSDSVVRDVGSGTVVLTQAQPAIIGIALNLLSVMRSYEEQAARTMESIAAIWAAPIRVPTSPVQMLMYKRESMPSNFTWIQSAYSLMELVMATEKGILRYGAGSGVTSETVSAAVASMITQRRLWAERTERELEQATGDPVAFSEALHRQSYAYIHTLERFLYTLHIKPVAPDILLEHVLTPVRQVAAPLFSSDSDYGRTADFFLLKQAIYAKENKVYWQKEQLIASFKDPAFPAKAVFCGCMDQDLITAYMDLFRQAE